jgi:hypothetical protein
MYLFLLAFGAILTLAGIVLGISGISLQDRAFDTSIVASGLIAAAGGLILVGLGLALRVLQRIELALVARPMPAPVRAVEPATATEGLAENARISFPPKADHRVQAGAAAGSTSAEHADLKPARSLRLQFPTVARVENGSALQEGEAAPLSKAALRVDEAVSEFNSSRTTRQRAPLKASRLDLTARTSNLSDRPKDSSFDALWPKRPRPSPAAQPTPAVAVPPASPQAAVEIEQNDEPAPKEAIQSLTDETTAAVSVLKSGVVDGMAYTLYSDGSIEAQLPQGTLRFGSITELRNHIEQSPSDMASS